MIMVFNWCSSKKLLYPAWLVFILSYKLQTIHYLFSVLQHYIQTHILSKNSSIHRLLLPQHLNNLQKGSWIIARSRNQTKPFSFCYSPNIGLHSTIAMPYIQHYGTKEQKVRKHYLDFGLYLLCTRVLFKTHEYKLLSVVDQTKMKMYITKKTSSAIKNSKPKTCGLKQEQYLPAMAAGECVASLAITEPDAGSDMQVKISAQYLHLVVFMFCQQPYAGKNICI